MEARKRPEESTQISQRKKAKENLLKIICRMCQKVTEKIEDIQFHFYFVVGQNTKEKI